MCSTLFSAGTTLGNEHGEVSQRQSLVREADSGQLASHPRTTVI